MSLQKLSEKTEFNILFFLKFHVKMSKNCLFKYMLFKICSLILAFEFITDTRSLHYRPRFLNVCKCCQLSEQIDNCKRLHVAVLDSSYHCVSYFCETPSQKI